MFGVSPFQKRNNKRGGKFGIDKVYTFSVLIHRPTYYPCKCNFYKIFYGYSTFKIHKPLTNLLAQ